MKQVKFGIEEMRDMREALNDALQMAITLMSQKGASQSSVSLAIDIDLDGNSPEIKYRTSVSVPMKINNAGREQQAGQIMWDQEQAAYVMLVEGEQVKI